eukprot:scaffold267753_cov38-Tisochrysis_lutea.AAC.1
MMPEVREAIAGTLSGATGAKAAADLRGMIKMQMSQASHTVQSREGTMIQPQELRSMMKAKTSQHKNSLHSAGMARGKRPSLCARMKRGLSDCTFARRLARVGADGAHMARATRRKQRMT